MGKAVPTPPKIFNVNWFRTDDERQVRLAGLRPEHARAGVDRRALPRARRRARDGAGFEPDYRDLNWTGLDFAPERFAQVMQVEPRAWARELASHDELFAKLGAKRPAALAAERDEARRSAWRCKRSHGALRVGVRQRRCSRAALTFMIL